MHIFEKADIQHSYHRYREVINGCPDGLNSNQHDHNLHTTESNVLTNNGNSMGKSCNNKACSNVTTIVPIIITSLASDAKSSKNIPINMKSYICDDMNLKIKPYSSNGANSEQGGRHIPLNITHNLKDDQNHCYSTTKRLENFKRYFDSLISSNSYNHPLHRNFYLPKLYTSLMDLTTMSENDSNVMKSSFYRHHVKTLTGQNENKNNIPTENFIKNRDQGHGNHQYFIPIHKTSSSLAKTNGERAIQHHFKRTYSMRESVGQDHGHTMFKQEPILNGGHTCSLKHNKPFSDLTNGAECKLEKSVILPIHLENNIDKTSSILSTSSVTPNFQSPIVTSTSGFDTRSTVSGEERKISTASSTLSPYSIPSSFNPRAVVSPQSIVGSGTDKNDHKNLPTDSHEYESNTFESTSGGVAAKYICEKSVRRYSTEMREERHIPVKERPTELVPKRNHKLNYEVGAKVVVETKNYARERNCHVFTFTWYKNGIALDPSNHSQSSYKIQNYADHSKLAIFEARKDDSGLYKCIVQENDDNRNVMVREYIENWELLISDQNTNFTFPLTLNPVPEPIDIEVVREVPIRIIHESPRQECILNEKTSLKVKFENLDQHYTIEWTHNFEKIVSDDNRRIETREDYTAVYIDSASELDCGIYVCKISTPFGSKYSSTLLTIQNQNPEPLSPIQFIDDVTSPKHLPNSKISQHVGSPIFTQHFLPQNCPIIKVKAGHDVHLEAKIDIGTVAVCENGFGNGHGKRRCGKMYDMEWYLDGQLLGSNDQVPFQVLNYSGIVVVDMRRINKRMCGSYKCRVWNEHGEDASYFIIECLSKLVPVTSPRPDQQILESTTQQASATDRSSMNLEQVREVDIIRSTTTSEANNGRRRKKRPQAFDQVNGHSDNTFGSATTSFEQEELYRQQRYNQAPQMSSFTNSEQHASGKVKKRAGVGDYGDDIAIQRTTTTHHPLRDQTNTTYGGDTGRYESRYEYDGPNGRNGTYYESYNTVKDVRDEVAKKTEVEEHWHEEQIIFRPGGKRVILQPVTVHEQTTQHREELHSSRGYSAPYFKVHLHDQNNLVEGQPVHLETRLEPKEDPDMKVDWYFNNVPLQTDRRVHTVYDYGYASLSIIESKPSDSGIYVAKASNKAGEAFTTGSLCLAPMKSIITETQTTRQFDEIEMQKFRYNMGEEGGAGRERGAIEKISKDMQVSIEAPTRAELKFSKPTFTSRFEDTLYYKEGDRIKLDANLVPLGDKSLRVEWLKNGEPLQTSDRIRTYCEHGRVGLEIYPAELLDEGVYTCQAISDNGYAAISTRLKCIRVSKREDTDFGDGYGTLPIQSKRISPAAESTGIEEQLEILQREVTPPRKPPPPKVKPRFITRFPDYFKIHDGKPVTFEAKYIPTDDPDLRVEWYHNGKPLKSGHRFRTYNESGNVALHMLYTHPQDEGIYTCRIVNKAGDDEISTSLHILDPDHGYGYKGRLSDDADKLRGIPPTLTPGETSIKKPPGQKPSFTSKLRPIDLDEGQGIHLEAKLEPLDDTNLKVKWYKDGEPLKEGPKVKTGQDKGVVFLDMDDMKPGDSGEYMCKASNDFGDAVISAPITVHPKPKPAADQGEGWFKRQPKKVIPDTSLAPESHVRRRIPKQREEPPPPEIEDEGDLFRGQSHEQRKFDTEVNLPPRFITDISDLEANEWDKVRFEARLEPANDKTMQIFWYHDGKILNASSRIKTLFDYGVVILEITDITTKDAGLYECIATNNYGSDSTRAVLRVRDEDRRIIEDTGLSSQRSSVARVKDIEETIERTIVEVAYPQPMGPDGFVSPTPSSSSALYRQQQLKQQQERISSVPVAIPPRRPLFVTELSDVRVKEHENIRLEAQIEPSAREDPTLQVGWYKNGKLMLAEETGARYRALNDFGFVILQIHDARPSDSGEYVCVIRNATGQALSKCRVTCGDDTYGQPPHFVNRYLHLENLNEGDTAHVEFRLEPADDQNMRVEWFFNGQPLCVGYRIKTLHDFGYAILDISPIYVEDSGVYECKATNLYGTKTAIAVLDCKGERNATLDTHIPAPTGGTDQEEFSSSHQQYRRDEQQQQQQWISRADVKLEKREKPIFTTPLQKYTNLREGDSAHFVTTVEPANDANMKITWYVDGKPIVPGTPRTKLVHNFGYVVLDISPVHASDSGAYVCVAKNAYGEDTVSGTLLCKPIERIEPPRFRVPLKNVELNEGQTAHFKAILEPNPDPNLRVEWYFNDEPLLGSARFRPTLDVNVATLDIAPIYKEDSGTYKIVVTYAEGRQSAVSTATLKCYPKPVLPAPRFIAPLKLATPSSTTTTTQTILKEGRSAILETHLSPGIEADMEWFLNGRNLKDQTRFRAVRDAKSGYVGLQNLYVYHPEDGGHYTVTARNESGSDQVSADFTTETAIENIVVSRLETIVTPAPVEALKEKPRFILTPISVSVTEGESARFECKVTGSPLPTVEWRINETVVVHGTRFRLSHHTDQGTYETYVLEIPDTKAYDTGEVKVIAYNSEGQITSHAALTVTRQERVVLGEAPRFTKKLVPINTTEGKSAVFEVHFNGSPPPQVKWMRENFEIHDSLDFRITTTDHSSSLVIRQVCVEDTGIFSCNLLNTAGWGECAANLNVEAEVRKPVSPNVAPSFITPLEPQLISAGSTAVFECRIAGYPPPQITWYKGGVRLHETVRIKFLRRDTDYYSLVISQTMPGDIGVYECLAVNAAGECRGRANLQINVPHVDEKFEIERIETIVTETLPSAPRLIQPLRDYISMEGQSAHFQCSISGYPSPTINWYKGDALITTESSPVGAYIISEAKDGVYSLKLAECFLEDEAIYSCEAINASGTIKTSARLRVQQVRPNIEGPSFIRSIDSTRIKVGQPVTFTCTLTGKPRPEVTWFKDGLEIMPSTKYQLSYSGTTSKLTVHDCKEPEDNGTYVCKAKNIGGTAECSAALLVESKPKTDVPVPQIISPLVPQRVSAARYTAFQCQFTQYNYKNIVWTKNENTLAPSDKYEILYDNGICILRINNVDKSDEGIYTCKAVSQEFDLITAASLQVVEKLPDTLEESEKVESLEHTTVTVPRLLTPLLPITVHEGESATLACGIKAAPNPTINWYQGQKPLHPVPGKYEMIFQDETAQLKIHQVDSSDQGVYTCRGSNGGGEVTTSSYMKVISEETSTKRSESQAYEKFVETRREPSEMEVGIRKDERYTVDSYYARSTPDLGPRKKLRRGGDFEFTVTIHPDDLISGSERMSRELKTVTHEFYEEEERRTESSFQQQQYYPAYQQSTARDVSVSSSSPTRADDVHSSTWTRSSISRDRSIPIERADITPSPPEVIMPLAALRKMDGDSAFFECQIVGHPFPQISWFHDGRFIHESKDFRFLHKPDGTCVMFIVEVFPEDEGVYTCEAINPYGRVSTSTNLIVDKLEYIADKEEASVTRTQTQTRRSRDDALDRYDKELSQPREYNIEVMTKSYDDNTYAQVSEEELLRAGHDFMPPELPPDLESISKRFAPITSSTTKTVTTTVEDESITKREELISIHLSEPPMRFSIKLPAHLQVPEGDTIVIRVKSPGTGPLTQVAWYKNGTVIKPDRVINVGSGGESEEDWSSSSTHKTRTVIIKERMENEECWQELVITNVDKALDEGRYECRAVNGHGERDQTTTQLKVLPRGSIKAEELIREHVVELGSKLEFTVNLPPDTDEKTKVQWRKEGQNLLSNEHHQIIGVSGDGTLQRKLLIPKVTLKDGGLYSCLVNDYEIQTKIILKAPELISALKEAEEGKQLELTITLPRNPEKVAWKKDGVLLAPSQARNIVFFREGRILKVLFKKLELTDEGIYTCCWDDEETHVKIVVTQRVGPQGYMQRIDVSEEKIIEEGQRLELSITLLPGDAAIKENIDQKIVEDELQWLKDGINIGQTPDFGHRIFFERHGDVQKLVIVPSKITDSGVYECRIGKDGQKTIRIRVKVKKLEDVLGVHKIVEEGSKVELSLNLAPGTRIVEWKKDGVPIDPKAPSQKCKVKIDHLSTELVIPRVTSKDAGTYTCTIDGSIYNAKVEVQEISIPIKKVEESARLELTVCLPENYENIQWLKDDKAINLAQIDKYECNIEPDNTYKLIIKDVEMLDGGTYSCVFNDQEIKARVIVTESMFDRKNMRIIDVEEGDDITIKVVIAKAPDYIVWRKEGDEKILREDDRLKMTSDQEDRIQILTISKVKQSDVGIYSCEYGKGESIQTGVAIRGKN